MTAKQFATALEDIILEANGELLAELLRIQDKIYSQVLGHLKDLELDANGMIKQNAANRAIANKASQVFSESMKQSGYLNAVETYITVIPKLDQLAENYFHSISDAFKPNRQFMASMQKNVISSLESSLFNAGLESQIKRPLMDIINTSINSGGQFSGFLEQVKTFITGNSKVDGKLLSYARTLTRDALFNYSRAVQQAVTNDLGLKWYFYLGGVMDKTRSFCLERVDKYWHESEVKVWASLEWQGKRPDTTESSIFVYAGGYNCSHTLVPVSDVVVPKEDLNRIK
jgi:hypothetical protein